MKAILDNKKEVWVIKIGNPYCIITINGKQKKVRSGRLQLIEPEPKVDGIGIILFLTLGAVIGLAIILLLILF